MRIESVRVRNFRSIKDVTVTLGDYTGFLGPNGSGKSAFLHALNVFYGEPDIPGLNPRVLGEEDFHKKDTKTPIEITLAFADLSDEAKADLAHYVRHDKLIVSARAEFDSASRTAEVKQFGSRLAIKDFAPFFEAHKVGEKVSELKTKYESIKLAYPDLPPPTTKDGMRGALQEYEQHHREKCEEVSSADEFYGISRGKNLLEKHIQWVYVPAVKDAATEQAEGRNTALGRLLARTVRSKVDFKEPLDAIRSEMQGKYQALLAESQGQLDEISNSLGQRLAEWAHDDATIRLHWHQEPDKAVRIDEPFAQALLGEQGFEGELTRFGHGLQRSFLLTLLQELAGSDADNAPALILACEEPELYQHPPQARHLYNVFLRLSATNAQVMVATHSPYFVSGDGFENVRLVRKVDGASVIRRASHEDVSKVIAEAHGEPPVKASGQLAKIHQALQPGLSEMFFASKVVFVEGLEDGAYITASLHLMNLWDEYRRLGCHLVPTHGKSMMVQPLAVANALRIPAFAVLDADSDKPEHDGSKEKHRKDNEAILKLSGMTNPTPFPSSTVWGEGVVMWASDLTQTVAHEIGEADWSRFRAAADKAYGHAGNLRKNVLHIAHSLQLAWDEGKKSGSLERLCKEIIAFARK